MNGGANAVGLSVTLLAGAVGTATCAGVCVGAGPMESVASAEQHFQSQTRHHEQDAEQCDAEEDKKCFHVWCKGKLFFCNGQQVAQCCPVTYSYIMLPVFFVPRMDPAG